jgi:hypothetical protein
MAVSGGSVTIKLKKFDIKNAIDHRKVIVLLGKRGTGKSTMVRDIMYHVRDLPIGTIISPTEHANRFFSDFVPSILIHDEYKEDIIANYVKRQKKVIKQHTKGLKLDTRSFMILDDCLYDNAWRKDKHIREIFFNGRWLQTLFMLTSQYVMGLPPAFRGNIDFTFILRENIVSNRKKIYENYAGMFPTFEMFCTTMDQCTENYECLVINNSSKSNKIEDQVFWYKADDHAEFKVCSKQIWDISNAQEKSDEGSSNEVEDYSKANMNKRGPKIKVKKTP